MAEQHSFYQMYIFMKLQLRVESWDWKGSHVSRNHGRLVADFFNSAKNNDQYAPTETQSSTVFVLCIMGST